MDARVTLEILAGRVEEAVSSREAFKASVKVAADTLAVAYAAPHLDDRAYGVARALASGGSGRHVVLGLGVRAGLLEAVAANSFLAHSLELDDWLPLGYVHAGAVVVPPALAAAVEAGSSVEDMARAVAAGYEVAGFVGAMLGRGHYNTWHTTSTAGSAGAAAAFAIARGLGVEASLEAAALALNYTGGLWEAARSGVAKPFSAMHAASLGVKAALARASGVSVDPSRVVEAVCRAYGCGGAPSLPERPLVELSRLKFYSACYHSHSAIRAAEELAGRLGGAGIERVVVRTYSEAVKIAGIPEPGSVEEARFSIPFLVALTLTGRRPMPGSIRKGLKDEKVLGLAGKVSLEVDGDLDSLYPSLMPAEVIVYTGLGRLVARVNMPPNTLVSEVGVEPIMRKAADLAGDAGTRAPELIARALLEAAPGEPVENVLAGVLGV